jgi:hypothetical protein
MAELTEQLDAARDELLDDDDELFGHIKEVEKRLYHKLIPDVTPSNRRKGAFMASVHTNTYQYIPVVPLYTYCIVDGLDDIHLEDP